MKRLEEGFLSRLFTNVDVGVENVATMLMAFESMRSGEAKGYPG